MRVKENDKLPISGDCDLAVEDDTINLYRPGQSKSLSLSVRVHACVCPMKVHTYTHVHTYYVCVEK